MRWNIHLARMNTRNEGGKMYKFDKHNPYWRSEEGIKLKHGQRMINGRIVMVYPDNDGGLWFYHPETGRMTILSVE